MRNKYLILAASAALVFGACSDDITQGGNSNSNETSNALTLKRLDSSSQKGRVNLPGETRGPKADRLQLVAKIKPVVDDDAINKNWSATGIAIQGGNAYVTWHSNHQATNAAQHWGGAIDVLDIEALKNKQGDVITTTLVSQAVKFNNIVASGANFYVPMTSYTNGAVVGRWNRGSLAMDTITLPGSSANSVEVKGNDLYAVTGYAGGLFKVNADFNVEGVENTVEALVEPASEFGGKYITGDYYLRTDDTESQIVNLNGTVRNTGAPLLSAEKYAEAYDPANGEWYELEGEKARHYGKHTMAVDGRYIYVGGGQGANGENGLRVYATTGLVWQNGTNTTAVCVDDNYVYAATGAGLRVYNKYDNEKDNLPLFAYEVLDYDKDGMAADHEGSNQPVAGTDAHSANFVAVDGEYIFVACGQSGVYVFKLNANAAENPEVEKANLQIPAINYDESDDVDEDTNKATFTIPETKPEDVDKEFEAWRDPETGEIYQPGDEVEVGPGETVVLEPVWKEVVKYNVTIDPDNGTDPTSQQVKAGDKPEYPENNPTKTDYDFEGWTVNGQPIDPATYVPEGDVTIKATWKEHVYKYIVKFVGWTSEQNIEVPADLKSDTNSFVIPDVTPVWNDAIFYGWSLTEKNYDFEDPNLIKKGDTFVIPNVNENGQTVCTLYGVWASEMQGGTGEEKPKEPTLGGEDSNGKS